VLCLACEAENKDGAKFCNECGAPLSLRCPRCGAGVRAGQKYCDECGVSLQAGPEPEPEVAPAGGAPVLAEMRLVSVLFVDLVGFTSLSEAREAEDVRALLGRYFDSARTVVERYGGAIEKFIGDAVMAVWGVPAAHEDDAERAVRAALELVDAVATFGSEVGAAELRARAGVVTGQVAAVENPGEALVVGDRVNTASRVQSAAQPGSVLVDEVTRQVTSAAIAYSDAGEHSLKGKAEALRLWRAVRVVAGRGGADREQGLEAPFVGRDGDLRLLKDLFHGALDRRAARLVAVSGEAGVGKSRLRREFANYVDGLSETVLWHSGRCLSYGDGVAYWALAEMVRQRLGIPEDAARLEAEAKLAQGLERWVPDAGEREFLSPRLGVLLGVAAPDLGREELFAGWRLFFERLAAHEPVALVFEDMQWADQGLLDFIEQLLDWSARSPIFMLTLARPELASAREGWPTGRRGAVPIQLEPLDDAAMHELLEGVVDGLPGQAAERIVAQAQGVPLYALETVRALAGRGVLSEREGRLRLEGELGELDVPASLSSLLASRLDALDPAERALIKAMSVFGDAFPRSTAAVLGDVPEDQLDAVLASLVRKQVLAIRADPLSPDRGQYTFAQLLLRTVAYDMLSRQERKPRHRAAAQHLQQAFPNDGEEVAEAIAAHYLDAYRAAAGDADAKLRIETIAALRRAAQRAASVGAPEIAERSYRNAAELAGDEREQAELTAAAGEVALQSGRAQVALELLEAAAAAHRQAGRQRDAAGLAGQVGDALGRLGRHGEAAERIIAALHDLSSDRLDPEVAALNAMLGRVLMFSGNLDAAAAPLEAALRIAEALELPAVLSNALNDKASIYVDTGRINEARILYGGAIEIAERHALAYELWRGWNNRADAALRWDLPETRQDCQRALEGSRRRGDRYWESLAAGNLMNVLLFSGRWSELDQLAAELLDGNERRPGAAYIHCRVCFLQVLQGRTDAARASLAGMAEWENSDNAEVRTLHAAAVLAVYLAEGDLERVAEPGLRMLRDAVSTIGVACELVRFGWPDALDAALRLGRLGTARGLLALLADQPPGHIPPYLRAQLARARGLIAAAEARHEAVEDELAGAIARLRELDYPYWQAVAETDLAHWLATQRRSEEAAVLLDGAVATFESLGATPALDRARNLSSQSPAEIVT
jgi:class 3 adenylate cyclase/tetratricopeptide (TPR) repeat protein